MAKPERSRGQARPPLSLLESLYATLPSWTSPCANCELFIVFSIPSFSLFRFLATEFKTQLDDRANPVRRRGYTDPGSNEQLRSFPDIADDQALSWCLVGKSDLESEADASKPQ